MRLAEPQSFGRIYDHRMVIPAMPEPSPLHPAFRLGLALEIIKRLNTVIEQRRRVDGPCLTTEVGPWSMSWS